MVDILHTVKRGDNLTKIGRKYGFDNPGPIFHYHKNNNLFKVKKRTSDKIFPGDKIYVPLHPKAIEKRIEKKRELIKDFGRFKTKISREELKNKKEIDNLFGKIDLAFAFLSFGSGIKKISKEAIKKGTEASTTKIVAQAAVTSKDIYAALNGPEYQDNGHKLGLRFFNAINDFTTIFSGGLKSMTNVTFWASAYGAFKDGNWDAFLYGTDGVHGKSVENMNNEFRKMTFHLDIQIASLERQKGASFYQKRI